MKLRLSNVLVCVVAVTALTPRSARAEALCASPTPSLSVPPCRAPRVAGGTLLELTRTGPAVFVGGASLQIEVGATRFAITMSLPL